MGKSSHVFLSTIDLTCEKRLEPAFAVVAAHAAFSHAAERHLARCQVDDDVVDAAAAELQLVREAVDVPLIARE